jgi:hypothetical protein
MARSQGGSGKFTSHRAMIEAAQRAKNDIENPVPGQAYFVDLPPGASKGYRRTGAGEDIEEERYVLRDEGPGKPGVVEAVITRARVFFREDGSVKSIHPFAEG